MNENRRGVFHYDKNVTHLMSVFNARSIKVISDHDILHHDLVGLRHFWIRHFWIRHFSWKMCEKLNHENSAPIERFPSPTPMLNFI